MKTILLRAVIVSLLFGPIQTFVNAQSSPPDAQLKGTLLDASGAGVGGVHVAAQLAGDSQAHLWKATSTTAGEYTLAVPAGKYQVVFQRTPFVTREFELDLRSGQSRVLDLREKTDTRQFVRLMYHADGVVCPVTFAMHLAAAVEEYGRRQRRYGKSE